MRYEIWGIRGVWNSQTYIGAPGEWGEGEMGTSGSMGIRSQLYKMSKF